MSSILSERAFIEELREAYLFSGLDEAQFQQVLLTAQFHTLAPDTCLFEQGQTADRFFLVRRGFIRLSRLSPAGEEKVIEFLQAGETFAEALMFSGKSVAYPVSARAVETSEVMGFENRAFVALLKDSAETCMRFLESMSKRMHGLLAEIDRLALQGAAVRLAGYLLANGENGVVGLRAPKHVIASRLSVTPETLSRTFARLAGEGLIKVHGAHIDLLRPEALQRLVEGGDL